jgi:hypothetical protein
MARFTKKNYQRAAILIRGIQKHEVPLPEIFKERDAHETAIKVFTQFFREDNPRFPADLFRAACHDLGDIET